jgi:hypothetical protein
LISQEQRGFSIYLMRDQGRAARIKKKFGLDRKRIFKRKECL